MELRNVLMIAPTPPLPDSGAGVANFGTLYELQRRRIAVDLVCFSGHRPAESLQRLRSLVRDCVFVAGPPPWSIATLFKNRGWQQPLVVARHQNAQMQAAIATKLATNPYEAVLVEFSFMLPYLLAPQVAFASNRRPLWLVEHHVVTPRVYEYFSEVDPHRWKKLYRRLEIGRLKKYLQMVLRAADKHLLMGQEDLAYLQQEFPDLVAGKLAYRPVGLILDRYPLLDPAAAEPAAIGFFGAFGWAANGDAVHYFVDEILPRLQMHRPDLKFVLAGRAAPPSIRALADHPAIEFAGEVDDLARLARRVSVLVAPLRIGGGTRLKILEALAWGKPVVATSVGVEGIEHLPGEELLVADEPEAFAQAILALLNDSAQQRCLAQAGRRRIESTYTVQHSVDRLLEAVAGLQPAMARVPRLAQVARLGE